LDCVLAAMEIYFWDGTFSAGVFIPDRRLMVWGNPTGWSGLIKEYGTPFVQKEQEGEVMFLVRHLFMLLEAFLLPCFATYVSFDMDFSFRSWGLKRVIIPFIDSIISAILYLLFYLENNSRRIVAYQNRF